MSVRMALAAPVGFVVKLYELIGADMNLQDTDQQLVQLVKFRTAKFLYSTCSNSSASAANAVGGIYTATGKGGQQILPATTAYTAINTNLRGLGPIMVPDGAPSIAWTGNLAGVRDLYLNLTTAHGTAATLDFAIYGEVRS